MLGTVEEIGNSQMTITLDGSDNASKLSRIIINPKHYSVLNHGYATTIHESQGVTVDHAYEFGSATMDKHLTYVAMIRHKYKVRLYTDSAPLQKVQSIEFTRRSMIM